LVASLRPFRLFVFFTSLILANGFARGAAPTLDHLFPISVQVGTTSTITAIGKFDPWPAKVWVDVPGVTFRPATNNGKFSVEVASDAPVGPHLIRLFNDQGSSGPRFLIVTSEPQLLEAEPNDDFRKPQIVEHLPASLNARLEKSGDVDSFAIELEAGQTLVASVEAFTLASPVDAVLRVLDSRGIEVAFNHDGSSFDPFLAWTAKSAGSYVVQVFGFAYPAQSEIKFTGGDKCVYRLNLSRGPYLRHTWPLGVQRGASTSLRVDGWNLPQPDPVPFNGSDLPAEATQAALRLPGCDNAVLLPVGDGPELIEQEPNDIASETNRHPAPFAVTGCIGEPGDEDRFSFSATKDEKLVIAVQSASLGRPLDAWLRIEDEKGREKGKNDDSGGPDPKLEWTAPEDGTFVAVIGGVLQRGGPDYLYRLSIQRGVPSVKVNVSETAFTIKPGKTNEVKITVKRLHGFKPKLWVAVKPLPDGVEMEPSEVPEKGGELALKLVASDDAKPFSGPVQIVAAETDSGKEHRGVADLTSSSVDNGVPGGFTKLVIESTEQFWLTVLPVEEKKKEEKTGKAEKK
jgi:hypothetical protein